MLCRYSAIALCPPPAMAHCLQLAWKPIQAGLDAGSCCNSLARGSGAACRNVAARVRQHVAGISSASACQRSLAGCRCPRPKNARCPDVFRPATTPNEENLGPDRPDDERHGADRAGGVPLADLRPAMPVRCPRWPARAIWFGIVAGPAVVLRHGDRLRRTVEALSRGRLVLLLRRAGVSVQDPRLQASPGWPSSSSAGPATCTTGSIRA